MPTDSRSPDVSHDATQDPGGFALDPLRKFRQPGAITAGHPEYGHAKGVETTTGPLGQRIANAAGMAKDKLGNG